MTATVDKQVVMALDTALSAIQQLTWCERCHGMGKIVTPLGEDACPACGGSGSTHPNLAMPLHYARESLRSRSQEAL